MTMLSSTRGFADPKMLIRLDTRAQEVGATGATGHGGTHTDQLALIAESALKGASQGMH